MALSIQECSRTDFDIVGCGRILFKFLERTGLASVSQVSQLFKIVMLTTTSL